MKKLKKILKFSFIPVVLVLLSSCDTTNLNNDLNDIGNKIIPNIWAFLAQLLAFLVLVVILIFVGYKPLKKYMNKRKEALDNETNKALQDQIKAKENVSKSEQQLTDAKIKAQTIVEDAKKEATIQKEEIIASAKKEADETIKKAFNDIEIEKNKASNEIKDKIVDIAFLTSEEILKREIISKDNEKIIDDYIDQLNNKKDQK